MDRNFEGRVWWRVQRIKAYKEGYEARMRREGGEVFDNPHPVGSELFARWLAGYRYASNVLQQERKETT